MKLDRAVLLFATLGGPEETRLETASWLTWVPRSLATVAAGQDDPHPWLPAPIRERFDTARESCFEHFVLVRLPQDGDSWLFCGNAHLGSWGTRNDGRHEACFSLLEERLTPDAWRALGGWTGWHVTIDDECFDVQCEQTEVFAERLDRAAAKDRVEIMLDAPTGETFTCYLNAARGALSYMAGTGEPWTLGLRDPAETSHDEEMFFDTRGPCDMPVERCRTLPREAATRALAEIVRHQRSPREGERVSVGGLEARWAEF